MKQANSLWENIFRKKEAGVRVSDILGGVPIFSELKGGELKELERIVHTRHYKANETIFHEGEPGLGMYIILEGEVGIFHVQKELTRLGQGDFFGEIALLTEEPRSATAVALGDTEVMGFFRPDLFGLLESNHRIGGKVLIKLAEVIAARLKKTTEELQALRAQTKEAE